MHLSSFLFKLCLTWTLDANAVKVFWLKNVDLERWLKNFQISYDPNTCLNIKVFVCLHVVVNTMQSWWWNFHFHNRNVNPIIFGIWDGKNSLFITQGTIIFPHSRLSSHSEEQFPHERRSREWGIFVLPQLLSYEWGNINVPWVMNREFFPSQIPKMIGFTFLL